MNKLSFVDATQQKFYVCFGPYLSNFVIEWV